MNFLAAYLPPFDRTMGDEMNLKFFRIRHDFSDEIMKHFFKLAKCIAWTRRERLGPLMPFLQSKFHAGIFLRGELLLMLGWYFLHFSQIVFEWKDCLCLNVGLWNYLKISIKWIFSRSIGRCPNFSEYSFEILNLCPTRWGLGKQILVCYSMPPHV